MSSMSPPGSDAPTPAKKRGGGSRGGAGGGTGRGRGRKSNAESGEAAAGGTSGRGAAREGSGRGRGRGRKKRQSTAPLESAVGTPVNAGSTLSMHTPGAGSSSHPSPGLANIASILEEANSNMPGAREGSIASASRRSATTKAAGRDGVNAEEGYEDEDDEDSADEDGNMVFGDAEYDEQAKERAEAKEALRLLLDQFSPEQLERYEVYRRSGLQKAAIRRLINHVLQQSCSPQLVMSVRGLSKVFVGEIVEIAREVQAAAGETGPLTPDHLREAYARYKATRDIRGSERSKLFVR